MQVLSTEKLRRWAFDYIHSVFQGRDGQRLTAIVTPTLAALPPKVPSAARVTGESNTAAIMALMKVIECWTHLHIHEASYATAHLHIYANAHLHMQTYTRTRPLQLLIKVIKCWTHLHTHANTNTNTHARALADANTTLAHTYMQPHTRTHAHTRLHPSSTVLMKVIKCWID